MLLQRVREKGHRRRVLQRMWQETESLDRIVTAAWYNSGK